jgi:S1-C subfamily serine protease
VETIERPRERPLLWVLVGGIALLLVFAGAGAVLATAAVTRAIATRSALATVPQQTGSTSSSAAASGSGLAAVERAVVDIDTVITNANGGGEAAGTGMIVSSDGEVLTNNHVVEGATRISVTIPASSRTYSAQIVGVDPADDVALIKMQGVSGLPTVTFADSSTLTVGEHVTALGNALGQGGAPSVTEGEVTALDQSITASDFGTGAEQLTGMIEADASISPGDSGGPLVNDGGQVIGMITAGQSSGFRRATSTNVGFAIPSDAAVSVVNQIRSGNTGSSIVIGDTAFLGVSAVDGSSGALVVGVVSGSPADQLGIGRDALITSVGGHSIDSAAALGPVIHSYRPGQQVEVSWVDAEGSHTGTAVLASGPAA